MNKIAARRDRQDTKESLHSHLTDKILNSSFDVMNTLGVGFLESVYKRALIISIMEKGLKVDAEKAFDVRFKNEKVGLFIPDLIVENTVIIELKCCESLLPEHQAQLINYLKVTNVQVGLLVNFGKRRLEYKRSYHPVYPGACDPLHPVFSLTNKARDLS